MIYLDRCQSLLSLASQSNFLVAMAVMSTLSIASASLALFANSVSAASPLYLSPDQEIVLPSSSLATNPLEWLGANGPYYEGPDVYGVGNEVPEGCVVEQVAYVSRHGSRYPDSGAYAQWAALYGKVGPLVLVEVERRWW
jgi:hypothetical protein